MLLHWNLNIIVPVEEDLLSLRHMNLLAFFFERTAGGQGAGVKRFARWE